MGSWSTRITCGMRKAVSPCTHALDCGPWDSVGARISLESAYLCSRLRIWQLVGPAWPCRCGCRSQHVSCMSCCHEPAPDDSAARGSIGARDRCCQAPYASASQSCHIVDHRIISSSVLLLFRIQNRFDAVGAWVHARQECMDVISNTATDTCSLPCRHDVSCRRAYLCHWSEWLRKKYCGCTSRTTV